MNNSTFQTAESVRKGHPDKFCDRLADRILDAHLKQDPNARVAIEAMICSGRLLIAGEVTSRAYVDYYALALMTIADTGYQTSDIAAADGDFSIDVRVHTQSPDIAHAVDNDGDNLGAGDQGIAVGYATDETPEKLPMPVVLAHKLCRTADNYKPNAPWLGADGKAQVTVRYEGDKPVEVSCVVISLQHSEDADDRYMRDEVLQHIVLPSIPASLFSENTKVLINPSGRFVLGGPAADTGLTGRKLVVDQYGPAAHIGGGALCSKDATKVDRSGAYYARYIAVNLVAAGLAKRCEVQLSYAIGVTEPVSITATSFGTGMFSDGVLAEIVKRVFDARPASIIRQIDLRRPIYEPLACYGHFGRIMLSPTWEREDKVSALLEAAGDAVLEGACT